MIRITIFCIVLIGSTVLHAQGEEVVVAAAASLSDCLGEAMEAYRKENPGTRIIATYGGSGSLQQQIEQGAPVDIFIPAALRHMDALAAKGLVVTGSRRDLVRNEVVLVVPLQGARVASFADLGTSKAGLVALGEPSSVPVGQYGEQILAWFGILTTVKAKAVYGKDVRQVLAWVEAGEVDAGIVYGTDAALSLRVRVVAQAPEGSHSPVVYPAALISTGTARAQAAQFLSWLQGPGASAIFTSYGFIPVGGAR